MRIAYLLHRTRPPFASAAIFIMACGIPWISAHSAENTWDGFDLDRFWDTYYAAPVPEGIETEAFYAIQSAWDDIRRREQNEELRKVLGSLRLEWRNRLIALDHEMNEVVQQAAGDAELRQLLAWVKLGIVVGATIYYADDAEGTQRSADNQQGGSPRGKQPEEELPDGSIRVDETYVQKNAYSCGWRMAISGAQEDHAYVYRNPACPIGRHRWFPALECSILPCRPNGGNPAPVW